MNRNACRSLIIKTGLTLCVKLFIYDVKNCQVKLTNFNEHLNQTFTEVCNSSFKKFSALRRSILTEYKINIM
jgi:hypothetical protein